MPPEPRSHRHRSQPRSKSRPRSPSREPSRRRPHHDARGSYSPTREPELRSRERHRQDAHQQRAKSRPPGSGRGSRDSRGKPSVKRPRVRFSMIEAEGAAETLTAKATQSGFLRKQADNEPGAWNEYYFVIKPLTYLFYYNSKDDETPRGIIDLEYLTDIKRNADCLQRAVGGGDNCFRVSGKLPRPTAEQTASGDVPKMRPLYLDTDNDDEAEKWMDAIRNHRFSLKKDEQFFEMVHQLRDAESRVTQLEEAQQKAADTKTALRVKAKTLLQKMRAVDKGDNTDDLPEVDVDDLDDVADDMLAMLEGMEDVLINLQGKLDQQKEELSQMKVDKAGTTSTRRGFTQVLQRAVSRRENTSFLELSEDEEEDALAAIRSRRQRKPQPQVIQEQPTEKPKEKPQEKPREKPQEKSKEKVREEPPALDNVSDVLAMWKAKKKKKTSSAKQPAPETDDEEDSSRERHRSVRGKTTAPDTQSTRKYTSGQKSRGSDRSSEEDTVSLDSTDDRESGEKLPPGWTKHESRGYPGTFYYAHESGKVSWDVPTDDMTSSGRDNNSHRVDHHSDHDNQSEVDDYDVYDEYDNDHNSVHEQEEEADIYPDTSRSVDTSTEYLSEYESDAETAGGTTSAAYRKKKQPKPKSAWAFKLPKLLPTTQAAPTEVPASLSPIRRAANNHEF